MTTLTDTTEQADVCQERAACSTGRSCPDYVKFLASRPTITTNVG
jgi:hypothetical protein